MGFFGALGKIVAGKPVFTPEGEQKAAEPAPINAAQPNQQISPWDSLTTSAVPKTIPQLRLGRIENRVQNGRYELYVDIMNASAEPVFIDNITLLGARAELDSQLRPGETRQYRVYNAQPLTSQPNGYAELRFRKQADGDYFMAYYQMRFEHESDGFYKITEFRPTGPVKDI
jgi:hypothetical protein